MPASMYKPPKYQPTNDLVQADQNAIRYLLNPNPDFSEVDNRAAAAAVASGAAGGTRDQARRWKLRDSELINRYQIGHQMLQPYEERSQRAALQTQGEQAQLNNIAAQGQQAMEQLRLQEQGLAARQSASERAALERAVLEGNQAMERLRTSESGATTRQQAELDARIAQLYLGEEGQNARLASTIAADRERQTASDAAAAARQQAALEAQLQEARMRDDIESALQTERLLTQSRLQTQSERANLDQLGAQGRNQLAAGRQAGIFDLARIQANQPDPQSNPNYRPNYRMEQNPLGGTRFVQIQDAQPATRGSSRLDSMVNSVDRILSFYGI
jgi:hypothetical protein